MIMEMTCAFGFLVAIMIIFHDGICYYILEYYFGYHVAFGLLLAYIMIFPDGIWYYDLEYYFGYHVAFGLLVASVIFIMMLDDIIVLEYDVGDEVFMWIIAG